MTFFGHIWIKIVTVATGVLISIGVISPEPELVSPTPATIQTAQTWETSEGISIAKEDELGNGASFFVPVPPDTKSPPVIVIPVIMPAKPEPKVEPVVTQPVAEAPVVECKEVGFEAIKNPNTTLLRDVFAKPVVVTTVTLKMPSDCENWKVDYEYDTWQSEQGVYVTAKDTVKGWTEKTHGKIIQLYSPVEGTHTATFTAYSNASTTQPFKVEYKGGYVEE